MAAIVHVTGTSSAGGLLPALRSGWNAFKTSLFAARPDPADRQALSTVSDIAPSLAAILRPQAAYRWVLPYLSAITPQYVEGVLRGMLAGNHVQGWELFDLMIDTWPELRACVGEYIDGILSKRILFEPFALQDEEPSDLAVEKCKFAQYALTNMTPDPAVDDNALPETIRDIVFSRFHGQSVLEINWTLEDGKTPNIGQVPGLAGNWLLPKSTYWVHPICYAWDVTGRLGLRYATTDMPDVTGRLDSLGRVRATVEPPAWNWITSQPRPALLQDFPANKFLFATLGDKTGTVLSRSVLRPLAWWWVASNYSGEFLMRTAELFGVPFRHATYRPGLGESEKSEVRQMLQSMGSTGWALTVDGVQIDFKALTGGQAGSPQKTLFDLCNAGARAVVLHQTMTGGAHDSMGKGGGKAFGDVESDVKDQCIGVGARYAGQIITKQFIPALLKANYGDNADALAEAPIAKLVNDEYGDINDAQRDSVLVTFLDMPNSYLHSKYGVPKPKAGEDIAGVDVGTLAQQAKVQQQQFQQGMKQKVQQSKQNAQALAQQRNQQQQQSGSQAGEREGGQGGVEGRRRRRLLTAGSAQPTDEEIKVGSALQETVNPILKRLEAISKIEDPETRQEMLRKLLKDHKQLAEAIGHDDSVAKAIAPSVIKNFLTGMQGRRNGHSKERVSV